MSFTPDQVRRAAAALRERDLEARRRLDEAQRRLVALLPKAAVILREHGARRVLVLGSLDTPLFRPESDVDLVAEGLSGPASARAERRLVELFARHVDLIRWEEMGSDFRARVLREGRELHVGS